MNGKLILLVEDSKEVQNFNKRLLEGKGFVVETAMTLAGAGSYLEKRQADAVILDIGMPDGNGLEFLRKLRRTSNIPVLILTGYDKDEDVVRGFENGCDDYLPKPYTFEVLLARLRRMLQRAQQVPETITKGPLTLKPASMTAHLNGDDLALSQKEFVLLTFFVQNEDRVMSAEHLYENVWNMPMAGDDNAIKVTLSKLRKKISGSGYTIAAVYGEGYRFEKS